MRVAGWTHHLLLIALVLMALACAGEARAEPYLAVQMGLKCGQCHVNPTGGGERTAFGNVFAQSQLPAQHLDTGPDLWTGAINRFLSVGADVRAQYDYTSDSKQPVTNEFDLEQARVYATASVIPQRLLLHIDEQVGPGAATNMEAWAMYWSASHQYYIKAGQMYLPFGFRLQDQTAYVQTITAINMGTPEHGVEVGWEHGHWDAQFVISNGELASGDESPGKQYTGQLIYVMPGWRVGAAVDHNALSVGNRDSAALFAGLRTGPVAWLAQADLTSDDSTGRPNPLRRAAGLLEADWRIQQGHNLKITTEYINQNRDLARGSIERLSVLYEWTPIQFLQIRPGVRYSDAAPGLFPATGHGLFGFIELHAFM
jgi:hypothetical protein